MKKILLFFCLASFAGRLPAQTVQKTKPAKNALPVKAGTKTGSPPTSLLYGMFSAPTGTSVVIQNNGKNDLTTAVRTKSGKTFNTDTFHFPAALPDGSAFK